METKIYFLKAKIKYWGRVLTLKWKVPESGVACFQRDSCSLPSCAWTRDVAGAGKELHEHPLPGCFLSSLSELLSDPVKRVAAVLSDSRGNWD